MEKALKDIGYSLVEKYAEDLNVSFFEIPLGSFRGHTISGLNPNNAFISIDIQVGDMLFTRPIDSIDTESGEDHIFDSEELVAIAIQDLKKCYSTIRDK